MQDSDEATYECFICGKKIDAGEFYQISNDSRLILLCSPICVIHYNKASHREEDARQQHMLFANLWN